MAGAMAPALVSVARKVAAAAKCLHVSIMALTQGRKADGNANRVSRG